MKVYQALCIPIVNTIYTLKSTQHYEKKIYDCFNDIVSYFLNENDVHIFHVYQIHVSHDLSPFMLTLPKSYVKCKNSSKGAGVQTQKYLRVHNLKQLMELIR